MPGFHTDNHSELHNNSWHSDLRKMWPKTDGEKTKQCLVWPQKMITTVLLSTNSCLCDGSVRVRIFYVWNFDAPQFVGKVVVARK